MSRDLHRDPVARERILTRYLNRKLEPREADEFESHYLFCNDCYEELRATELLIYGLDQITVERSEATEVAIIRFSRRSELTSTSLDTAALVHAIRVQSDSRVLIDLSNVSRIDSAGLGMLMSCYCHVVKNRGALRLLNANSHVKRVLKVTKVDSVMQTADDEQLALQSFGLS